MRDIIGYMAFLAAIGIAVTVPLGLTGCAEHTEYVTGPPVPVPVQVDTVFSMLMVEGDAVYRGVIYSDDTTRIELIAGKAEDRLAAHLWVRYHHTQQDTSKQLDQ